MSYVWDTLILHSSRYYMFIYTKLQLLQHYILFDIHKCADELILCLKSFKGKRKVGFITYRIVNLNALVDFQNIKHIALTVNKLYLRKKW